MKKAKIGKKLAAMVLVLATMMAFATTVFADAYDSYPKFVNGNYNGIDIQYKAIATLYQDSSRDFRAALWLSVTNQTYVSAGWMGGMAELVDYYTGRTVIDTNWELNKGPAYYLCVLTDHSYTSQTVIARGKYTVFTGSRDASDFTNDTVPRTGTRSINESLLSTLDANGNYPTTDTGKTYGSVLLADVVGYEPDLISAQGSNGISGYVKNEDLYPTIETITDYENYRIALEANEWKIPLYDLQGNIIGDYQISKVEPVPEDSTFSYEEARAYTAGEYTSTDDTSVVPETSKYSYAEGSLSEKEADAVFNLLCEKWLVNGEYQKTADGKTYGPSILYKVVGKEPDLTLVQGVNGNEGFIMTEDRYPLSHCKTPEERVEYIKTHPSGDRTVPVYDLEGNVIDMFTFHTGYVEIG